MADEAAREIATCSWPAMQSGGTPLIVSDAACDPRFRDDPLVTGPAHLRFYAGVELDVGPSRCGATMCVGDGAPRPGLDEQQSRTLRDVAAMAEAVLRLPDASGRHATAAAALETDQALRESETRYRTLAEALPQMVIIMSAATGEALYENRRFAEFHGLMGLTAAQRSALIHPADADRVHAIRQRVLHGERRCEVQARLRRHDGVFRWHKIVTTPITQDGAVVSMLGTALDIDDVVTAHQVLERTTDLLQVSEERLALALEAGEDGLFDIDLKQDTSWVSPRWLERIGYDPETVDPRVQFWLERIHSDDLGSFLAAWNAHLSGTSPAIENEHRLRRADDTYIWVLARARVTDYEPDGQPLRLVGTLVNISHRKEAELRITHMAEHDALTDLPNRYLFCRELDRLLGELEAHGPPAAVLVCDLDRFKTVNDTLGHFAGDRVLCIAAERLRSAHGPASLVARLGGDEFAVIARDIHDEASIRRACERIIAAFGQPLRLDEHSLHVGISVGGVLVSSAGLDAEELFKRADIALYQAKGAGRNGYSVYEAASHHRIATRGLLALDMTESIRRGDFFLVYQPIIDIASGAVVSCEALMRWRHPSRGLVPPDTFIPIAEEAGLIVQLGQWALAQACQDATSWPDTVRVAVNVSALQIRSGLDEVVAATLEASGLAPHRLKLEITESALTQEPDQLRRLMDRLRAASIRIALDDFGTGYSSLAYLSSYPFDEIKIDRSFVQGAANSNATAIIRAVVDIGTRFGMDTIAEGVETREQLDLVRREGCTQVQGFFFSPPLGAREILAYIGKHVGDASKHQQSLPPLDHAVVASGLAARSQQVRAARMRLGWSQSRLARESDVDLASIYLLERMGTAGAEQDAKIISEISKHYRLGVGPTDIRR